MVQLSAAPRPPVAGERDILLTEATLTCHIVALNNALKCLLEFVYTVDTCMHFGQKQNTVKFPYIRHH